jgi:hypothetical protein
MSEIVQRIESATADAEQLREEIRQIWLEAPGPEGQGDTDEPTTPTECLHDAFERARETESLLRDAVTLLKESGCA